MSFTQLTRLQEDLQGRLLSTLPSGVSVLLQRQGVLERELLEKLGTLNTRDGLSGALALVRMPAIGSPTSVDAGERSGPPLLLTLAIDVWEDRLTNQTGTTVEELALRTLTALHRYRPGALSGGQWLAGGPRGQLVEPLETRRTGLVGYRVLLETQLTLPPLPARAALPTLVLGGPLGGPWTATLATATSGAEICYTLDGSFPWPGNPTAAWYQGLPLNLDPNTNGTGPQLRATAHREDLTPSDVLEHQFQ